MGPAILERLTTRDDQRELIRTGIPARGMAPTEMTAGERSDRLGFLRGIERRPETRPVVRWSEATVDGRTIEGALLAEGFNDIQSPTDARGAICCAAAARGFAKSHR